MMRTATFLRRPMAITALLTALALPTLFSASWAQENYCPGTPWNCEPVTACWTKYWCKSNGSVCSASSQHFLWSKTLRIKECDNPNNSEIRHCSSCSSEYTLNCCKTTNSQPSCPNVQGCP